MKTLFILMAALIVGTTALKVQFFSKLDKDKKFNGVEIDVDNVVELIIKIKVYEKDIAVYSLLSFGFVRYSPNKRNNPAD